LQDVFFIYKYVVLVLEHEQQSKSIVKGETIVKFSFNVCHESNTIEDWVDTIKLLLIKLSIIFSNSNKIETMWDFHTKKG
jgi:hypothetical protein